MKGPLEAGRILCNGRGSKRLLALASAPRILRLVLLGRYALLPSASGIVLGADSSVNGVRQLHAEPGLMKRLSLRRLDTESYVAVTLRRGTTPR